MCYMFETRPETCLNTEMDGELGEVEKAGGKGKGESVRGEEKKTKREEKGHSSVLHSRAE